MIDSTVAELSTLVNCNKFEDIVVKEVFFSQ